MSRSSKFPVLYRHFNKTGELLYVGISISSMHRLGEHSRNAKWFKTITTISLEHFSTITQAREAERSAIWFEKPKYNIQHNKNPKTLAPLLQGPLIPEDYVPGSMVTTHMRLIHVMQYTTLSKSLITKIIEHDGFPAGKCIENYYLWSIAEINAWLATKTINPQ